MASLELLWVVVVGVGVATFISVLVWNSARG
jgi:hypothetical protein